MHMRLMEYSLLSSMRSYVIDGKDLEDWWCDNISFGINCSKCSKAISAWKKATSYAINQNDWDLYIKDVISKEAKDFTRIIRSLGAREGIPVEDIWSTVSKHLNELLDYTADEIVWHNDLCGS